MTGLSQVNRLQLSNESFSILIKLQQAQNKNTRNLIARLSDNNSSNF